MEERVVEEAVLDVADEVLDGNRSLGAVELNDDVALVGVEDREFSCNRRNGGGGGGGCWLGRGGGVLRGGERCEEEKDGGGENLRSQHGDEVLESGADDSPSQGFGCFLQHGEAREVWRRTELDAARWVRHSLRPRSIRNSPRSSGAPHRAICTATLRLS